MSPGDKQSKVIVSAQIATEKREEWESYVDENPNVNSISHLIRLSVAKEIHGQKQQKAGSSPAVEQGFTDVLESVGDLSIKLDQLSERMNDVEREVRQDSDEVTDVAGQVFDVLPTEDVLITDTHESVIPTEERGGVGMIKSGRVDHISTRLGISEILVGEALEKLQTDTALVHSKSIGGHRRFYKEV